MAIRQNTNTILDIGTNYAKILQVNSGGKIVNYAVERLPEGCIKGLFVEAEEPLARAIKAARQRNGIKGGGCTLTLSGKDMIVRHLNLPKLPDKQLYQNILLEMAAYLPVDSEKHAIDFKIIEEIKDENSTLYRIMVATLHKRIIENFTRVLKNSGFTLKVLDANENAQEKFIRSVITKKLPANEARGICLIDMGADTTKVNIFNQGRFFVGYLLNKGGNNITNIIAHHLQTDIITAENYKMKTDFFNDQRVNPLLSIAVKNEIDSLIYEISKVADYYWSRSNEALGSVILSGGASLMPGFQSYFKSSVSIPLYSISRLLENNAIKKDFAASDYAFLFNAFAASFREE